MFDPSLNMECSDGHMEMTYAVTMLKRHLSRLRFLLLVPSGSHLTYVYKSGHVILAISSSLVTKEVNLQLPLRGGEGKS